MLDADVLIIGAGMSGIGMAAQLIRNFNTRNFEIIEKTTDIGGTWFVNSYPGCGCDVPSHFYSYSFAPNPNWTRKFAMQPEIYSYFVSVAEKYDIRPHVRFETVVIGAEYDSENAQWKVTIEDLRTGKRFQKRCRILISGVGTLSTPKGCDIPGAESFQGRLFHSATWDHEFDYKGKDVVCIGNGCSATQFVPAMSSSVRNMVQFTRQAHWLAERPNPEYSNLFRFIMRWVPGVMYAYRAYLYTMQEKDFPGFRIESGKELRESWKEIAEKYIRENAPAEYEEALVPKTVIGCKRRVMDTDYLACLHRENVELVHDDPVDRIQPTGVVTKSGREIKADAIILANGFETQRPLFPMDIRGQNGTDIFEHWMDYGRGSPEAYFGTCLSGFPNFFILMGPNTLSGHLSVIYTTECQINFVIRAIRPILDGIRSSLLPSLFGSNRPDSVAVSSIAERSYNSMIDHKAKQLVWATGCASWFIDETTGRNTIMFPDFQFKFWLRSIFVPWKDFIYTKVAKTGPVQRTVYPHARGSTVAGLVIVGAVLASLYGRENVRTRTLESLQLIPKLLSR